MSKEHIYKTKDGRGLDIRYARESDIQRLRSLYQQLIPGEHPTEDDMRTTLSYIRQRTPSMGVVVVSLNEVVVGTCQLVVYENLVRTPWRKAIIDSVVVDASVRNQGIGKALMQWAVAHLQSQGCATIAVSSAFIRKAAHGMYRGLGFSTFGNTFILISGGPSVVPDWATENEMA